MDRLLAIGHRVLADTGDFLEMLGPLLLFGIYAIGAVAKKWANSKKSESEEKPPTELQKAVRKRYQQIYERQTGKVASRPEPVRTRPQETLPVRSLEKTPTTTRSRTLLTPQLKGPRRRQPAHQRLNYRQEKRIRRQTAAEQTPAAIKRPQKNTIDKMPARQRPCGHSVLSLFQQPASLQSAVIMKEILDKPLALRDF